ncbi:MAG: tetratricopeptide repeat protein [bacterium]
MSYIIPLIIIFACLAVIGYVIGRKFSAIANMDTKSMPEVKEAEAKKRILAERLKRKIGEGVAKAKPATKFVSDKLGDGFKKLYHKALEVERKYQKQASLANGQTEQDEQKIEVLLGQAEELFKTEKYPEAEQKYIKVIGLDPKNVEAYRGLGDIYTEQKNYDQAKETLEFALKLNQNDAATLARLGRITSQKGSLDEAKKYYLESIALSGQSAATHVDLALVCKASGDQEESFKCLEQAAEIEPNNPRYLDLLLEMSIILGKKEIAQETLKKLKEVNPDNQKLKEREKEIRKMKANSPT